MRSSLRQFLPRFFDFISKTFWGQPARRLGVQLPWQVAHALSLLTIAAIVVAFFVAKPLRRYLVALLILCLAQGYLLLQTTWLGNRTHVRGTNFYTGLQGRYLFPLIVPLAVFFAVAGAGVAERFSRRVVVQVAAVVVAIGFLLHWAMWVMMLDGYWQAPAVSWSQHLPRGRGVESAPAGRHDHRAVLAAHRARLRVGARPRVAVVATQREVRRAGRRTRVARLRRVRTRRSGNRSIFHGAAGPCAVWPRVGHRYFTVPRYFVCSSSGY